MLIITVSSVAGKPTFNVDIGTPPAIVRKMVAQRYGYQAIGVPHNWSGNLS